MDTCVENLNTVWQSTICSEINSKPFKGQFYPMLNFNFNYVLRSSWTDVVSK